MSAENPRAPLRFVAVAVAVLFIGSAFRATPGSAASFDCEKANEPDEKVICADRALNDLDVQMSVLLEALGALQLMGSNADMRDGQRKWLATRRKCGSDRQCLANVYKARVDVLRTSYHATALQRQ